VPSASFVTKLRRYRGRCAVKSTRAAQETEEQRSPVTLAPIGELLLASGNEIVAAASVLGENQKLAENPGSLSGAGCTLANAGRALVNSGDFLSRADGSNGDWDTHLSRAAEELSAAAGYISATGAEAAELLLEDSSSSLHNAASALLEARFVDCDQQGSWVMEDANLSLVESGQSLSSAAAKIKDYARSMSGEVGPCALAGEHLYTASTHLEQAGDSLCRLTLK